MKKLIISLTAGALLLAGCGTTNQDALITTAATVGAATGMKFIPAAKRTPVANYVDYVATVIRAAKPPLTSDELTALINQRVPTSVQADLAILLPFVTPIIATQYNNLLAKANGNTTAIINGLNDIATGLEAAMAPYVTKG
jgi:hypothetical protein